jgi:hypothetical protein
MDGRTQRTWERISAISELGSEHGDHGWEELEEKNGIETLNRGFDFLKKKKILTPNHGCVIPIDVISVDDGSTLLCWNINDIRGKVVNK